MGIVEDGLKVVGELAEELVLSVDRFCDQALAGPENPPPDDLVSLPLSRDNWEDGGWWRHAKRFPSHPGRVGGAIDSWATVLHTTDMLPNTFDALVKRMQTQRGSGGGFHFLVGMTPAQGVLQFSSISRNGNHAGGPGHGWFKVGEKLYHPNLVSVGIEAHNAGGLRLVNKEWRWGEKVSGKGWVPMGPAIPDADVERDPVHPLRGWHRFTPWQLEQLDRLLTDLDRIQRPIPDGPVKAISAPESAPAWAETKSARVVGHVDLDAANRSDPWPPGLRWLRERAARIESESKPATTFEWRGQTRDV